MTWINVTPFELSLESDLHVEWQKFANEWLFKWHGMNYEGGVTDVDDFQGRRIHYQGTGFGHQQQQIFWNAIGLYLNQKTHEIFKKWDVETKQYPTHVRKSSIDGTERHLRQFVAKIVALSVDTDRRLRGAGYPQDVEVYDASGTREGAMAQVSQLAVAHRALMSDLQIKENAKPWYVTLGKCVEDFYANHKGLIWLAGLIASGAIAIWHHYFGQ